MVFSTIKEPQFRLLTLIQHHRATWEVLEGSINIPVCWAWQFLWLFLQVTEQISVNTEIWTHEPQPIAHGFKCQVEAIYPDIFIFWVEQKAIFIFTMYPIIMFWKGESFFLTHLQMVGWSVIYTE